VAGAGRCHGPVLARPRAAAARPQRGATRAPPPSSPRRRPSAAYPPSASATRTCTFPPTSAGVPGSKTLCTRLQQVAWKHGRCRRSCISWAEHAPRCSEWSRPHRCAGDDGCDALLQFDLERLLSESNLKGAQTPACPAGWSAIGRTATCSTPTRSPSRTASRSSRTSRRQTPRPLTRRPVALARRNRPAAATGAPRWCSFPAWTPPGHSMRRPRPSR